jgi:HSP20 family protein
MANTEVEVPIQNKTETTTETKTEVEQARRGPMSAVPRMQHEMERLFDDFMSKNWVRHWRDEWPNWHTAFGHEQPRVDVLDRDKEVVIRAELPGFKADEIDVSISDNLLTIKGSSRQEKEEHGEYHRKEISTSFLTRTIALPVDVDGDNVKATLEDGVLEVTAPKSGKSARRTIKVE